MVAEIPYASSSLAGPPRIADPDDIDAAVAARAFSGTSFSPESRGDTRRREYADDVNGLYARLWPMAQDEEQRAVLVAEMECYRQGLLSRMLAVLAAQSRVMSPMIAGPARFPVAANRKRCDAADNRVAELIEWRTKAQAAIVRKLRDAQTEEQFVAAEWRTLGRKIADSLAEIARIDRGETPGLDRSAFANSIANKVERLTQDGRAALVAKAVQFVADHNAALPDGAKPVFTARHKFWTFVAAAQAAAAKAARSEGSDAATGETAVLVERDGVSVVSDPRADRVRIEFASRPDAATVRRLKAQGWRWAPSVGAWQRKRSPNAERSALALVAEFAAVEA